MTVIALAPETAQRIAGSLLQFIWQGAFIAFFTVIGMKMLRRRSAESRYALGVAGLCLMLIAPIVTFAFYVQAGAAAMALLNLARHVLQESGPAVLTAGTASWARWILIVWLSGVSVFLLRLVTGWHLSRRLVRSANGIVPAGIQQMFDRLKAQLALPGIVRLLAHARIDSPIVVGWLRPVVILPITAITGLGEAQLFAVFAHELAHIRRRDFLVNMLQRCVEAILFYHPAVWWMSKRVRIERENCCDDLAVRVCGDRKLYAETLIHLERERHDAAQALAVAAAGSGTIRRIHRILGFESSRADWQSAVVAFVFVLVWITTGFWQPATVHAQSRTSRPAAVPAGSASQIRLAEVPASSPLGAIAAILTAQPVQPEEPRQAETRIEQANPNSANRPIAITVRDVNLRTVLSQLANEAGLSLSMPAEIDIKVTLDLSVRTVQDALTAILTPLGLGYEIQGKMLTVGKTEEYTTILNVNFVNRQGSSSLSASATAGFTGGGSSVGGGGVSGGSATSISGSRSTQDFSLMLDTLLAGQDHFFDKTTGMFHMVALPGKVAEVKSVLTDYQGDSKGQSVITAHYIEVQLNDPQKDIDWTAVGLSGFQIAGSVQPSSLQPMLVHSNFSTVLDNLRTQGAVRIVSTRKWTTLNHTAVALSDQAWKITSVDPRTGIRITTDIGNNGIVSMGFNQRAVVVERLGTATSSRGETRPLIKVRQANSALGPLDADMGVLISDGDTVIVPELTSLPGSPQPVPVFDPMPFFESVFVTSAHDTSRKIPLILLTTEIISTK